jgi:predicted nucleic acid-binding protein
VLRVVADTNVYISALNFAGTAGEVLALGRAGLIELFISAPILEEIEGVLVRKFHWTAPRVREAARAIRSFAVLVHPEDPRARRCTVEEGATHDKLVPDAAGRARDTLLRFHYLRGPA